MNSTPLPIWVVSLERATDRRARISNTFAALGLKVEICEAVDGKALTPEQSARHSRWRSLFSLGRNMSLGEIGCALSHQQLYQRMIAEDVDVVLIVEDDAEPSTELPSVLADLENLPPDWQVVTLHSTFLSSGSQPYRDVTFGSRSRLCTYAKKPYGTVCYLLQRDAAQRLVDVTSSIYLPADELLFRERPAGLITYGIEPSPVAHLGTPTGPAGFGSLVVADVDEAVMPRGIAEHFIAMAGKAQRRIATKRSVLLGTA